VFGPRLIIDSVGTDGGNCAGIEYLTGRKQSEPEIEAQKFSITTACSLIWRIRTASQFPCCRAGPPDRGDGKLKWALDEERVPCAKPAESLRWVNNIGFF